MRRFLILVILFLPTDVALVALGPEFQVNTYTAGSQNLPSVGMDSAGNSVVVWQSAEQDGSGRGVFGQRYDITGAPLGSEFPVNSYTTGDQAGPSVAMDLSGRFVVVWLSQQDGSDLGVFAQRFEVDGTPLGSEFQVNEDTTGPQILADVAVDDQGNFVVVWQSGGFNDDPTIRGRRFDVSGSPLGSEFQVGQSTLDGAIRPAVAMNGTGEFVVTWNELDFYNGVRVNVRKKPYDSSGVPLCGRGLAAGGPVSDHDLAMAPSGDFLVTWSRFEFDTGDERDVWVRRQHRSEERRVGKEWGSGR